jgi:hypothetical protein
MTALTRAGDPAIKGVRAWRWQLPDAPARMRLASRLTDVDATLQLFDDVASSALLAVSWMADAGGGADLPALKTPAWAADAERIAAWRAGRSEPAACLVVVRQPLKTPDPAAQRDWAVTVLKALEGDAPPPEGLLSANFFASRDGALVLNFAEWTSAEAHRRALRRGAYGQHGSIGDSNLWRATREHPAITPEHEVRRYERHLALAQARSP